ncbi:MAG TPA: K(+)-transporting ATPase subunit F [Holophagaceae bacterium]|nr:K(+)-transporting ATPase subunit F [Holophagaceae bacterium]
MTPLLLAAFILTLALFGYLLAALLKPEKFQ